MKPPCVIFAVSRVSFLSLRARETRARPHAPPSSRRPPFVGRACGAIFVFVGRGVRLPDCFVSSRCGLCCSLYIRTAPPRKIVIVFFRPKEIDCCLLRLLLLSASSFFLLRKIESSSHKPRCSTDPSHNGIPLLSEWPLVVVGFGGRIITFTYELLSLRGAAPPAHSLCGGDCWLYASVGTA